MLWIDIETRSECDLKTAGVYKYAEHPTTRVLCLAWTLNNRKAALWLPGDPMPPELVGYDGYVVAHNAAFERLVLQHADTPWKFRDDEYICSAHWARARGLPGALDNAGRFCGAKHKKDFRGAQLVKKCCIPPFEHTQEDLLALYEYCQQDVLAMRSICSGLAELSTDEIVDYHANEAINDRGFKVDLELARAAAAHADTVAKEAKALVRNATHGGVTSFRSTNFTDYVYEKLPDAAKAFMRLPDRISLDKSIRATLIDWLETHPESGADPALLELILAADESSVGSATKFARACELADAHGFIRGAYMFNGAHTGRASSKALQVQNFYRKSFKDPMPARNALVAGEAVVPKYGKSLSDVLRGLLRPMIIPDDGNVFVISDWSAIEARVNPWLSDRAEEKLDLFRNRVDVYKVNASRTFGVAVDDVDDGQRQIGKVQELSLGYGGGVGALGNMARAYGISLSEDEKQPLVDAWRRANHWAVSYWRDLERAVRSALASPAIDFAVGRMTYRYDESRDELIATLPSWRAMHYPSPRIDRDGQITYAKAAWLPGADPTAPWPRASLWGGVLAENNAQAAANCLLREALYACRIENLAVVLHSHDEIVVETPEEKAAETRSRLHEIMLACPSWAKGLPLAAETHTKVRYGK